VTTVRSPVGKQESIGRSRGVGRLARFAVIGSVLAFVSACAATPSTTPGNLTPVPSGGASRDVGSDLIELDLSSLEDTNDAFIGLYLLDSQSGREVVYRAEERCAYASTFKALLAGAVLDRADGQTGLLDQRLADQLSVRTEELVTYSPVTEGRVGGEISVREAIDAAVSQSDNTAANLLVAHLGGLDGFRDALRTLGDDQTSPARLEPELNDWAPGELRDTSTPRALGTDLYRYLVDGGDGTPVLSVPAREILLDALVASTTGRDLVRAGVPSGWVVGDKSGSPSHGGRNDLAILLPPDGRDPIVLAICTYRRSDDGDANPATLAEATRLALAALDS